MVVYRLRIKCLVLLNPLCSWFCFPLQPHLILTSHARACTRTHARTHARTPAPAPELVRASASTSDTPRSFSSKLSDFLFPLPRTSSPPSLPLPSVHLPTFSYNDFPLNPGVLVSSSLLILVSVRSSIFVPWACAALPARGT